MGRGATVAKRGNNEGSIYEQEWPQTRVRKDGAVVELRRRRWVASVTLDNGKRKTFYGNTREEVAHKLARGLVQFERGLPFTPETLTVGKYLSDWLDSMRPTLKPKTYASYEQLIRVHIQPGLGKIRLGKLQKADVNRFLANREHAGSSPRTRQYLLSILRMALEDAVDDELIARNVGKLAKSPRVAQREIQPFDQHAVNALLDAGRNHRFEHLFAFLLGSGLRLGEALALQWEDVNRKHGSIQVRHTLERIAGQPWRIAEPKSASGRRVVPLIGPAGDSLRAQHKRVAEMRLAAPEWHDYDLVFPSANGNPLDGTNVYHEFKKLLAKAGLTIAYRVHDLRHSTATYLLAAGVDGRIVMQVMGWSQVSMLKRYQHVLDPMLRDAGVRLEAVFPIASGHLISR